MSDVAPSGLALSGRRRQEQLDRIARVTAGWGLKMPQTYPPDLWDFGLGEWDRVGLSTFIVANNEKFGYCGQFMFQFAGQTCPMHHHRKKHETFFIVKGRVEMTVDGKTWVMEQGDVYVMNQHARHRFMAVEDALILESSMPDIADDSIFDDERINELIRAES
jgi:quercetin dioxygenase-like cupin family protein